MPTHLDLHLIGDNYSTPQASQSAALAGTTSALSYALHAHQRVLAQQLNMVERFLRDLTQNRLRRGVFRDLEELNMAIGTYIDWHNGNAKPSSGRQRNFEPMRKQIEAWQRSELTDVTAKVVIYEAFVESNLEAPKHLARTVHDLYFEPKYEDFKPRTIWSLSPMRSLRCSKNWIPSLNLRRRRNWANFWKPGCRGRSSAWGGVGPAWGTREYRDQAASAKDFRERV
jgi:hypothetical protein